jgi:hypothetical protein
VKHGEEKCCSMLGEESGRSCYLGRLFRDRREVAGREGEDWIEPAWERDRWRAVVERTTNWLVF